MKFTSFKRQLLPLDSGCLYHLLSCLCHWLWDRVEHLPCFMWLPAHLKVSVANIDLFVNSATSVDQVNFESWGLSERALRLIDQTYIHRYIATGAIQITNVELAQACPTWQWLAQHVLLHYVIWYKVYTKVENSVQSIGTLQESRKLKYLCMSMSHLCSTCQKSTVYYVLPSASIVCIALYCVFAGSGYRIRFNFHRSQIVAIIALLFSWIQGPSLWFANFLFPLNSCRIDVINCCGGSS